MKKNKKGFTLTELLAVIAIIGVISLIAAVSMNGVRNKIELKTIESNLELIIAAAKTYAEDNNIGSGYLKVLDIKNKTELKIDDNYNNIQLKFGKSNRRSTVCINKSDSGLIAVVQAAGGDVTNSRVNEENLQKFLCP